VRFRHLRASLVAAAVAQRRGPVCANLRHQGWFCDNTGAPVGETAVPPSV